MHPFVELYGPSLIYPFHSRELPGKLLRAVFSQGLNSYQALKQEK